MKLPILMGAMLFMILIWLAVIEIGAGCISILRQLTFNELLPYNLWCPEQSMPL